MSGKEGYNAAVKVYALYGAFFMEVAQEFGKEKAVALHRKAHELMGVKTGRMIKEQMAGAEFDLQTLGTVLRSGNMSVGIDCEVVQAPSSLLLRNSRCPIYDGYRMGGLDDDIAETLCRVGAPAKLGSTMKQLNQDVVYHLKHYRDKPDERCEEEIKLGQGNSAPRHDSASKVGSQISTNGWKRGNICPKTFGKLWFLEKGLIAGSGVLAGSMIVQVFMMIILRLVLNV